MDVPFVFSFYDPGPHGNGRYSEHMLPEVEMKDFRKGAQVYFLQDNLTIRVYLMATFFILPGATKETNAVNYFIFFITGCIYMQYH